MNGKRDIKIIIVPILIFFVFLFGIMGYQQLLGPDFSLPGAIYCTLFYFVLNNILPADVTNNSLLFISRYLAAITVGFGVYSLLYKHLHHAYLWLKIRYTYRDHIVVFSMKMLKPGFFTDLVNNKYKVILVDDSEDTSDPERLEKLGIVQIKNKEYNNKLFDSIHVAGSRACIVAFEDDDLNIELSLKLIKYLRDNGERHSVRVLAHISEHNNLDVMRDHIDVSNVDAHFEFEVFNIYIAASRKMYDLYPPHAYFDFDAPDDNSIAVIGYNPAAEDFILQNIILSHYEGCRNIKIYLVDKDADHILNHFMYEYPFCREFAEIVPVKLLNNKFFANFNWSKELIEKLSRVKCAYLFGNDGSELINLAARFRQFLVGQAANTVQAPIVICFPENTGIINLLDVEREDAESLKAQLGKQAGISFVNMITDTCTSGQLLDQSEYIDLLSRVINYYYSLKYEFEWVLKEQWNVADAAGGIKEIEMKLLDLAGTHTPLYEHEVEDIVVQGLAAIAKRSAGELRLAFSIRKWWGQLTYHNKSANRYAARHLSVKLSIMEHMGCMPLTQEHIMHSFPVIAPIEHKRWCAEKMVHNYRYGVLPADRAARKIAKGRLKIHDQLIPYEKLADIEKEKDLNIFLLMPLLSSLKMEIKR